MRLVEYPDREMMMIDLANKLAGELNSTLQRHDSATFCVPGGTTPAPVFDVLSDVDLDWSRVRVVLNDERWVPEDHPRSNTRLLRRHLFRGRAARASLVPLHADTPRPEDAIEALAEGVEAALPISVLLLGLGGDMHTASLIPGAEGLEAAMAPNAPTVVPIRVPGAQEARVTLSARVLDAALSKHVVITGPEKRAALERAEGASAAEAPIRAVWNGATVHWAE